MWVAFTGVNPSAFKTGKHQTSVRVEGKTVVLQPDNPVENITWWSALAFANKISEALGLPAAYDLSGVNFASGSAEAGDLRALGGELKINAPGGDIYQTEGFRLPTVAELDYLLSDRGRAKQFFTGMNRGNLEDYAWFVRNAEHTTQPVAQLKPNIIDGKQFFDLFGNITVWAQDLIVDGATRERAVRGAGFDDTAAAIRIGAAHSHPPSGQRSFVGLRLVRSVK
jgi:formylglycine-generating enzyme required for sulfatase activity